MKTQQGFTIIELLVAIVIIGVLAAVAIPKFNEVSAKAKCSELAVNLSTFERLKTFHYEVYGDADATLAEIGLDLPESRWFDYGDIIATAANVQTGGDIGTAAKGGNNNGNNGNGQDKDAGTDDADGNHGHGNDDDHCDSSNPGKSNPCSDDDDDDDDDDSDDDNEDSHNPASLGSLSGHTLSAIAKGTIGSKCQSGMGVYSNWDQTNGLTRGDISGSTCSYYMSSFMK